MKKAIKIFTRLLLGLFLLILLFMLGLFVYHRIMLGREKSIISGPIGEMIEVDGGKMCVYTEGSGEHTIVFMSGYGTPSPILDFKPLYSRLSDRYRIAVVEKFGYGFSDETDTSRDVDTMLRQTREALKGAGVEAPYILCPHSASGMEALYWAQTYPDEIEGITALDIAIPGYHEEQGDSIFQDRVAGFMVNSGMARLVPGMFEGFAFNTDYLTEAEKEQYKALLYARRGSSTMIYEAENCKANMDTVSSRPAPDVPMLFFTSKQMAALAFPSDPQKYLMLARNYTDNKAKYIDVDYGHYLHNEAPDYVAEEISSFIEGLGSSK
ncbi:MAG: alpha/beta hydrolase [Ruminococcus sp.]|nr:alpha/beta hydrolase [Ruminococcus sp.]